YGTLPVVHFVGGLVDSVIDANSENIELGCATGFHFKRPTLESFAAAVDRALKLFGDKARWNTLVEAAMTQDYSWEHSSESYISLYKTLAGSKYAN
ncbi:MAG: starch synthase, partial [Chromatiales bacterium]|nr:starch synthase [Chromatiales bacterium]